MRHDPNPTQNKALVFECVLNIGHIVLSIAIVGSFRSIPSGTLEVGDITDLCENPIVFLFRS